MHELTTKTYLSRFVIPVAVALVLFCLPRTLLAEYNYLIINPLKDTIQIQEKQIVYDTVFSYEYVYDTLYVYDTIFVDRLPIPFSFARKEAGYLTNENIQAQPVTDSLIITPFLPPSDWFLTAGAGAFYFENSTRFNDSLAENFKNDFSSSLHPIAGYGFELNLGKKLTKRWSVQAGISFASYHENFRYHRNFILEDSVFTLNDTVVYTQLFDTVVIYNLDALLQGDSTVYVEYPYSYWGGQNQQDTIWSPNDSILNDTLNYSSTWSVLEFPMLGIYSMQRLELMAGLIPTWLIRQDRYTLFPEQPVPVGRIHSETSSFSLQLMLAGSWTVPLSNQLDFMIKPWMKVPLYQSSSNQFATSRQISQGLTVGIRYRF